MAYLIISKEVGDDIDAMYGTGVQADADAAAEAQYLLEKLVEDQHVLAALCIAKNHYDYDPAFEVKPFVEAQRRGKNIFSIKLRYQDGTLVDQRLFIGYHAQKDQYHVLGIAPRSYCYDTKHEHFARLLDRYEQSGIPDY